MTRGPNALASERLTIVFAYVHLGDFLGHRLEGPGRGRVAPTGA